MVTPVSTQQLLQTNTAEQTLTSLQGQTRIPAPSAASPTHTTTLRQQAATASSNTDRVELSPNALSLSKRLTESGQQQASDQQHDTAGDTVATAARADKTNAAYLKSFPPFMGNSSELTALKQSSPALYREILRMIVPPPLNLTYTDLQALQQAKPAEQPTASDIVKRSAREGG